MHDWWKIFAVHCAFIYVYNIRSYYTQLFPLIHGFAFWGFTYPRSTAVWKQMIPLLMYSQKFNGSLTPLHHNTSVINLPSSHGVGISSSYLSREKWRVWYNKIFWERDHIHITIITVWCYNYSILSLGIVVNLLLCLIYKLKFIIAMFVWEKA